MSKTNIVFSASSLDLFDFCPRAYQYGHLMRKGLPLAEKPKPLDFGTISHQGLEVYFNQLASGVHFNDRLHNCSMKMRELASDSSSSNVDITEELPILINAVEQSCEMFRYEDEHLEILAVETPFDYILFEDDFIRIIISGKVDLLVNKPAIGGGASYTNLPYDHKTTSSNFPVERLSNQFINYAFATGSFFLIVNRIGLQKTLKPEEKFKRIPLSYDPLIIQEWKDNTTRKILDVYLPMYVSQYFPMRNDSHRKFGRLCDFYKVCDSSGESAKLFKLNSQFTDREAWDKYAENGDEAV